MRRLFLVALIGLVVVPPASASQLIDRDASNIRIAVSANGKTAVLSYRAHGRPWHVRAWGAINARPPTPRVPQVQFRIRRDARPMRDHCLRYDGPPLPWLVKACKAPDGSYWAVQRFQRRLPNHGYRASSSWLPANT